MKQLIRNSLSTKLTLGMMLIAAPVFILSLGAMFLQSQYFIRQEAKKSVSNMLNSTVQHVRSVMSTIETATNANTWIAEEQFQPDSLLSISRRVVMLNSHVNGCCIAAEPNMFPQYGRHFDAYSLREGDTIITVRDAPYEYFEKPWYSEARKQGHACWVEPYADDAEGSVVAADQITSYSRPIYLESGQLAGIITCDLSMRRITATVDTATIPYPHAYYMMIGNDGHYYLHPDSTRLYKQSIFTDTDPNKHTDLIALGHEMTAGKTGVMKATLDGEECFVCYQPVPSTDWSLALVCPKKDILWSYHKLVYIIAALIGVGLIVILLLCQRVVGREINPLHKLLRLTEKVAKDHDDELFLATKRTDAIGQLQNSFATMQQSLNFHMGALRHTAEMSRTRNEELIKTTEKAEEAVRQKTRFIQNMSHQIRTPLNIIMGFAQVLRDSMTSHQDDTKNDYGLPEEELASITNTMLHNAHHLNRMVMMLFDSSDSGVSQELQAHRNEVVLCNELARECVNSLNENFPEINIQLETELPDDCCIHTSRLYLMRSIRELLYNSAKYSDGKHVVMRVTQTENTICFIVEDIGSGLSEEQLEMIFMPFGKLNDLSEGLGLGLPLAKRHAQGLGGDLTLDTTYQEGCRFILELPKL